MKKVSRVSMILVLLVGLTGLTRACFLTKIKPGYIGVRYNNATGPLEEDLSPGYALEILGLQRVYHLPSRYLILRYSGVDQPGKSGVLNIRTKDNNLVKVDVSVPYRIIPGHGWKVMKAGNHLSIGRNHFRFERFANDTTISVLREHLAELTSQDFYNTTRRLEVARTTLMRLNKELKPLHLEAAKVLIRAAYFRTAYERQLAQIQLNEQRKLLDHAKQLVAKQQQKLDNYNQRTSALVASKRQEWNQHIAELDRAYQVGFLDTGTDQSPGAARRMLKALPKEKHQALVAQAAKLFALPVDKITDAHLLGIKNIAAETLEYKRRVSSAADAVSARLAAEGSTKVARVRAAYTAKLNRLLATPGGRAWVAYEAAQNIKFDSKLTFQAADGVPSVLRLRDFATKFMGR